MQTVADVGIDLVLNRIYAQLHSFFQRLSNVKIDGQVPMALKLAYFFLHSTCYVRCLWLRHSEQVFGHVDHLEIIDLPLSLFRRLIFFALKVFKSLETLDL